MRDLTKFIPAAAIALLSMPFVLFLLACGVNQFQAPPSLILGIFKFILYVPLYQDAIKYAQAPILLAITLKYYSPRALGSSSEALLMLPADRAAKALLIISAVAIVASYTSSYILGTPCTNCIRSRLVADLSLLHKPEAISELLGYCSALVASASVVATGVLVPTPKMA